MSVPLAIALVAAWTALLGRIDATWLSGAVTVLASGAGIALVEAPDHLGVAALTVGILTVCVAIAAVRSLRMRHLASD